MWIIGDVHGKWPMYYNLIRNMDKSIQLGDMGIGFQGHKHPLHWDANHVFFRGNHDNPEVCRNHPNCIGDWGTYEDIFFVAGAWSIDWQYRTQGLDWWVDEELSQDELEKVIEKYQKEKPDRVVTHDAPFRFCQMIKDGDPKPSGWGAEVRSTRTTIALDAMLQIHRPKVWVVGHWHYRKTFELDGMKLEVLPELGTIEI